MHPIPEEMSLTLKFVGGGVNFKLAQGKAVL